MMFVEQFVMAYQVDQDRIRALLPEEYESVVVGDIVKKEIDKVLEEEGLTPKKLMWYFICGIFGTAIGFLIVYLTGK